MASALPFTLNENFANEVESAVLAGNFVRGDPGAERVSPSGRQLHGQTRKCLNFHPKGSIITVETFLSIGHI